MVDGKRQLELGWALLRTAGRQGFATEIGRAGLDYAFGVLGHNEVVSFTEVHNRTSPAVMERLGMTFVKIIYERGVIEGCDGIHAAAPFALYRLRRDDAAPPPAAEARKTVGLLHRLSAGCTKSGIRLIASTISASRFRG